MTPIVIIAIVVVIAAVVILKKGARRRWDFDEPTWLNRNRQLVPPPEEAE